jgi:hypothetical protein
MEFIKVAAFAVYAVLAAVAGLVTGLLVCAGQPFAEYLIAGVRVHTRPDGLPERLRAFTAPADGDPAKPLYFYGPARADLRYVRQVARNRWRGGAQWWGRAAVALLDLSEPVTLPIGVGLTVGLFAGLPVAALLVAALWLTHELVVDVPTAAVWSAATTLRAFDSARLSVLRIRVRCVACFERIPYPAYLCPDPGCNHIHWDIRPGRYGVLRRTCECGQRMPTVLLLGTARKLNAICPHRACRHPLEYRPGEVPEIILPIFGSKGAGKTLLLHGMVKVLLQSNRPGIQVSPADPPTSARLDDLEATMASHSAVPATPAAPPRAYVLRLRIGRQHRIIQFLDAAGELFYDSQRSANLIYLGAANTFVLVIDPLSVNDFWGSLPTATRERFSPHRSLAPHPELAFQQTAERIAQMAKPRAQHRLAVVFSRADLLGKEYGPGSGEAADIQKWAIDDLGLAGLLRQARSEFREIAFFHTAAFGENEDDLNTLVHWLMRAEGITPGPQRPLSDSR